MASELVSVSVHAMLVLLGAAAPPAALPDKGVYAALDARVEIALPAWVPAAKLSLLRDRERNLVTVLRGSDAVKTYAAATICDAPTLGCLRLREADRAELARLIDSDGRFRTAAPDQAPADSDGDGIPDAVDILIGAKKTVLLATPYVETTRKLPYPGGDMPADEGVCTDVVVRALRNAGLDLQQAVHEDAGRVPKAYPAIAHRNPSIDHRRVRNLVPWFERHFRKVALDDLLPGDVVLLDTFPGRQGVEHIGVVSDRLGRSGRPLIANAWTNGFRTSEMDLLGSVAAPAAFRVPARASRAASPAFRLPPNTRQVVLAISDRWSAPAARVSWWDRRAAGWVRRAGPLPAMLGAAGLGWGRGLLPGGVAALGGPEKREGDERAPAGIFRLSAATGYAPAPRAGTRLPYTRATPALRCVDDPRSPHYNQIREAAPDTPGEAMLRPDAQYALAIVVDHNRDPVAAGAGSCIFLHSWPKAGVASPGCTMLGPSDIARLAAWLDPAKSPVLVQLPHEIYDAVAAAWDLPRGESR